MSIEIEQTLSSIYIEPVAFGNAETSKPTYGTRTQSILTLRQNRASDKQIFAELISHKCNHPANPK